MTLLSRATALADRLTGASQIAQAARRIYQAERRLLGAADHRPRRHATNTEPAAVTPFWNELPDAWDTVVLGNWSLPGLCTVEADLSRKIDSNSAAGSDHARVRDKGYEPSKISIKVLLWTDGHLGDWDAIAPMINPRRNPAQRVPLAVYHPSLEQIGVRQVYVIGLTNLRDSGRPKGAREATIRCVEVTPRSRRNVTHTASPTSGVEQRSTAFDPAADAGKLSAGGHETALTPADHEAGP